MFCSRCGRSIGKDDKVCPYCGSTVEDEEFLIGFWGIVGQNLENEKTEKDGPIIQTEKVDPETREAIALQPLPDGQRDGIRDKNPLLMRCIFGAVCLLAVLLIIQTIRVGLSEHTCSELQSKNLQLEEKLAEVTRKNNELQQSLDKYISQYEQDAEDNGSYEDSSESDAGAQSQTDHEGQQDSESTETVSESGVMDQEQDGETDGQNSSIESRTADVDGTDDGY